MQRELASCGNCGRLIDLRRVAGSAEGASPATPDPAGKPRARSPVQLPDGMRLTTTTSEIAIHRPWLRTKHWFMLAVFAGSAAFVAYLWSTAEAGAWLVVATLFVFSWNISVLAMFLNTTTVTAGADSVKVRHGPMPSLFARNASVEKSNIEQLYSSEHGNLFAVLAKLKSGDTVRLVAPLITAEQALFIEQQLERKLGLADFAIEGELDDGGKAFTVQGNPQRGRKSGAALAFLIPAFIVGILGLFYLVSRSELSGQLSAKGALGSWVFVPDDCTSGQREGFGGVVLTASTERDRLVRIVQDPVRGNLVVVVSKGQPNHVLASDSCARLQASVERTSTNINDIWVVEGSLLLECSELSGSVNFKGCH